ncbi:hypothetical protein ACHAWC_007104 [Mediolabrus comicus]
MHKNRDEISNTAAIIKIALENATTSKVPSIFLGRRVLDDPPFALFHEIIKFLASARPAFNWESLFLTLDCSCKQNQQLFLLRLLALVSRVNGVHYDVFLSPAELLYSSCGAAQTLLQALATSTMVSEEVMSAAVSYVLGEGDAAIYKKGVLTRSAISVLQLACRGWIGRRRRRKALTSSIDALLARKSKIEEDTEEAEARLQEDNRKLMRILRLKDTHRRTSQANISQPLHDSRPKSAPLPNNPSKPAPYPQDEKFADSIIDMSDLQSRMKRKEMALFERERKLKELHVKAKDKEAELQLHEERISELTDKIRKQQMQMKGQKLQLERSKALSVTSIPEPATKPCTVCIERKHHMRRAKAKFKQQVRLLNSMEKELRKREMILAEREATSHKEHHKKLDTTSYIPKSTAHPPKRQKRRNVSPHEDDVEDTEQCSHIKAMDEDEDEEISLEKGPEEELQVEALTPSEELPSEKEETTPRHSHSKQTPITRNIPKMTTTSPRKNASKHRKQPQKDETSQSQSNLPQPHDKHIFTFEKNHQGDDELDYVDAQLRCAVKSLRELI